MSWRQRVCGHKKHLRCFSGQERPRGLAKDSTGQAWHFDDSCSWLSWCIDSPSAVGRVGQFLILVCTGFLQPKSILAFFSQISVKDEAGSCLALDGSWLGINSSMQSWPGPTMMHCDVLRNVVEALFIQASNDLSIC